MNKAFLLFSLAVFSQVASAHSSAASSGMHLVEHLLMLACLLIAAVVSVKTINKRR